MNKVKNRTLIALALVAVLTAGIIFYCVSYVTKGAEWASFSSNRSIYTSGRLTRGQLVDRNGVVLLQNTPDGRVYNEDKTIRIATLHAVGDRIGNIGTSISKKYASVISGFDLIQGTYSFSDKGSTAVTTLDARLCADAYSALAGRTGSVLVYNYKTGEVLCMVSTPSYDPDNVPSDIETNSAYSGAYVNRCISSTLTPGSIFKLITTACAIDNIENLFDMEFECTGSYMVGGSPVNCQGVHGKIKIGDALAHSCNCAFAQLSLLLGGEKLAEYAERFGLTESFDMGALSTAAGNFEVTDSDYETAWSGIGQSTDLVCPMNMLRAMGAIANGGEAVTPRVMKNESSSKTRMISRETADTLKDMMAYNTETVYGTDNYKGLELCAKSGTAEVGGSSMPHAWFAGFLQNKRAPLAFVVMIEHGGSGSANAGAVANTVLQSAVSYLK